MECRIPGCSEFYIEECEEHFFAKLLKIEQEKRRKKWIEQNKMINKKKKKLI